MITAKLITLLVLMTTFAISCTIADDLVSVVTLFRHGDRSIVESFPNDPYKNASYWPEGYGELLRLFRHGDRSIVESFPNDPYKNASYWPEGYGELLRAGEKRHYALGQFFRARYNNFLSKVYKYTEILVQSSDKDRCLMSAETHLAGMYILQGDDQWFSGHTWEPVPIHTKPKKEDPILAQEEPCARRDVLIEEQKKSQFYKDIANQNAELFALLSEKTGWKIDDVHYIQTLQSLMFVYSQHNESYIPDWYKALNQTQIRYLSGVSRALKTSTPELKRLVAGRLIHHLMNYFDDVISKEDTPKYLVLSGHDTTLVSFLNAIEQFNYEPPGFADTIIFEMYKKSDGKSYYITMNYKKSDSTSLDSLHLKGCEERCDYNSFKNILEPLSISSSKWEKECKSS